MKTLRRRTAKAFLTDESVHLLHSCLPAQQRLAVNLFSRRALGFEIIRSIRHPKSLPVTVIDQVRLLQLGAKRIDDEFFYGDWYRSVCCGQRQNEKCDHLPFGSQKQQTN